jgi:hypothetical protein
LLLPMLLVQMLILMLLIMLVADVDAYTYDAADDVDAYAASRLEP